MTQLLSLPDVRALACDCLTRAGVPDRTARRVAAEIAAAEAAGERQHGMEALLRDIRLLRYGRIDPVIEPHTERPRTALLRVDARHGFAAAALEDAAGELGKMAMDHGIALARLSRASDPGAMIRAIQPIADRGLIALAFGATGPGRIAHPDLGAPAALTRPEGEALFPLMPKIQPDQPADSPLGGFVSYGAWIVAMTADAVDEGLLDAGIWTSAPPLSPHGEIPLSVDLLEQIVTA